MKKNQKHKSEADGYQYKPQHQNTDGVGPIQNKNTKHTKEQQEQSQ